MLPLPPNVDSLSLSKTDDTQITINNQVVNKERCTTSQMDTEKGKF